MFDFPNSPVVGQIFAPAGGPQWTWDGTVWKSSQSQGEMAIARTFIPGAQTGATTYTYSKPANLRHLEFEGVAAGGSGASALATAAATWSHGSAGGGGAWGRKLFTAAALPASVLLTIGQAGQPSASVGGNAGTDTTFGSLITLPGGRPGVQGGNVTYTGAGSSAVGSGITAYPTGVDVGRPGESSDPTSVNMNVATTTNGTWALLGRSGGSPWGAPAMAQAGTGGGQNIGVGYGWGSGGCFNAASAALRNSVVAGAGAVLLTEYLVITPSDVAVNVPAVEQSYTSSNTWSKPANLKYIEVEGVGPGGAGGAAAATIAGQWAAGSGGGAGAYGKTIILASALPATVAITIGAQAVSSGAGGGTSSFGSATLPGGGGGTQGASSTFGGHSPGANSGAATGFSINGRGDCGDGSFWAVASNIAVRGKGASSPWGGGGTAPTFVGGSAAGSGGVGYGSGGSGAANLASQGGALSGGSGAPSLIIVREFY